MAPVTNGTKQSGQPGEDVSIASEPCDIDAVPGLIADISSLGEGLSGDNRNKRLAVLEKARDLVRALETPRETMLKHVGGQTAAFFSLALGNDVELFKHLAANDGSPKSTEHLAAAVGFELDLLRRILRHLAAMGYISQTGPDEYKPTNFTRAMTIPVVASGYSLYAYSLIEPMIHFPKWLKINGYRAPRAIDGNPQMFGHRTDLPFFDWLDAHQPLASQFNDHMGGFRLGRPSWMDEEVFPVEANLLTGFDTTKTITNNNNRNGNSKNNDPVLLVDIGGSYGHDLEEFHRKHPHAPGRLILQDLPRTIDQISQLDSRIEAMPYDFLTPQPIHGARAYYLHQILHDYPDDRCVEIIEQVKRAMTPGYSKLLINEHVIPATGADWEATYLDLYLMVAFSARERTVEDWRNLLEKRCGLVISRFWDPGHGVEGVIECELPV
ncbi:S-adenosyl-L-methionine-dependent methyltransferase [Penicillium alfredii]|uniref:S-adenosyl-L-methionine-dependent methyltransferase n=1 Tax=Penicillium alfredii TaxID=1506179 RepID=A0A9W9K3V7_9EURO|nr:S-adenosyl-L-methionine-dependent methyltransferase [Penicillium alfredii]KAJ5092114.1 S-adenosyl-L-methionine-dependent methyltransferase [Penicillium alfredii]